MSYHLSMTITHQMLMDADGKPVAAQIPWDEFEAIQHRLEEVDDAPFSPEWRAELDRRRQGIDDGTTEGTPHDQAMTEVREHLETTRRESRSA